MGSISAYASFSLLQEDQDSKKAVLIYNINPLEAIKDYNTVIQLNYLEGDFSDLALYIKNSKITRIVYYQQENLPKELLDILRNEAGINLIKITGDIPLNNVENIKEDSNEILITGNITENQEIKSYLLFIVSCVLIIVILAIVLIFMPKKKRKARNISNYILKNKFNLITT